jgi:hypothetical protein
MIQMLGHRVREAFRSTARHLVEIREICAPW